MEVPIGVIFSTSGPYGAVGREMLNGALLGIEEVNSAPDADIRLVPHICDPGGDSLRYAEFCRELLRGGAVSHVIGCYTSSSRKEVIPVIEKYDALLWYPSHYEGFESCNNLIYLGASPNQHIVPLADYMLKQSGNRVYCCGSNYIWPWENNRVMREIVHAAGGAVMAEKYLPIGSTDVDGLISEIRFLQPDFVFNTLIGESSYAFFRAYFDVATRDPASNLAQIPITSCSLSEPELVQIGDPAACNHIASSVYFGSIESEENAAFVRRYRARFGHDKVLSADAEASYNSALLLAQAIGSAGTTEIGAVRTALARCRLKAPQGDVCVDTDNNHCYLTPRLGRSVAGGRFELLASAPEPVKPDPYLASLDLDSFRPSVSRASASGGRRAAHLTLVER